MEWQPIDSAPKDRTAIILGKKGEKSQQGRWYGDGPLGGFCSDNGGEGTFEGDNIPTHWMPLPPPPALGMHGGGK